ncbi:hypothetical protein [Bacillus cereus]|uniref:hypothetical protein n=1 Tax=Bacillus cereus TaxID=1396 RepID=UPI000BF94528|nr:hypothetical protein [Bacillus cereus]PFF14675.1 hypothetical protein CN343_06965 [Bacillus cereus]
MSNLTEAIVREALDKTFDAIAQGNDGHADVEEVQINGTLVTFKVNVVHKATTRILGQRIVLYQLSTPVKGKFDVLHPDESDLKVQVKTPVGSIQVSLADTVKALASLV